MAKNKKKKNTKLKVLFVSQLLLLTLIIGVLAFYFVGGYGKKVKALQEIGRAHV